jgi:hypothetical protein
MKPLAGRYCYRRWTRATVGVSVSVIGASASRTIAPTQCGESIREWAEVKIRNQLARQRRPGEQVGAAEAWHRRPSWQTLLSQFGTPVKV